MIQDLKLRRKNSMLSFESAMHAFLDKVGIFQINVKQQFEDEKKAMYSASPNIHKFTSMRTKQPSFMEKRARMVQNKKSGAATAPSSSGAQSVTLSTINRPTSLMMGGGATFSSEIFRGNRP